MKSKITQATKKSISLLLAILMMFSMLTVGLTVTVNAATDGVFAQGETIYFDFNNTGATQAEILNGDFCDGWYDQLSDKYIKGTSILEIKLKKPFDVSKDGGWGNENYLVHMNTGNGWYNIGPKGDRIIPTGNQNCLKMTKSDSGVSYEWTTYGSTTETTTAEPSETTTAPVTGDSTTTVYVNKDSGYTFLYVWAHDSSGNKKEPLGNWNDCSNYAKTEKTIGEKTYYVFEFSLGSAYSTFSMIARNSNDKTGDLENFAVGKSYTIDGTVSSASDVKKGAPAGATDPIEPTTVPDPSTPTNLTLAKPKLTGTSFVFPGDAATVSVSNIKDDYATITGVTFDFTVKADGAAFTDFTKTEDGTGITFTPVKGKTYSVTATASAEGYTTSAATKTPFTVKVAIVPFAEADRIYAYAATLADGEKPVFNAWTAVESDVAAKDVYKEYVNNSYEPDSIPTLGATTDKNLRVFLPTGSSATQVVLYNSFSTNITIGTVTIEPGKYGTVDYTPYTDTNKSTLTVKFADGTADKTIKVYRSEAQGALYINNTGDYAGSTDGKLNMLSRLYKGKEEGKIEGGCSGAIVTRDQLPNTVDKVADVTVNKIKGRGNSTWRSTDKKSFNVNFNENLSGRFLNEGFTGKKYSLLANFKDPSLSRNKILYALGDYMGAKYSPDVATIDLYLNGMYMGNYLMSQKVEVGSKDLVNDLGKTLFEDLYGEFAAPTESTDTIKTNGFSFLMELDTNAGNGDFHFDVNHGGLNQTLTIKEPEYLIEGGENDGSMPQDDLRYAIQDFVTEKYKALVDALNGTGNLSDIIDVDSLARYMMLNELAKNFDIGVSSTYFVYNKAEGKFYASPVWDLDVSTGNCDKADSGNYLSYEGDWVSNAEGKTGNKFMQKVFSNATVKEAVKSFWTVTFYNSLVTKIDDLAAAAKTDANGSFENNYVKWTSANGFQGEYSDNVKNKSSLTTATYSNGSYKTASAKTYKYDTNTDSNSEITKSQIDYVADWLKSRAAWLTSQYATVSTDPTDPTTPTDPSDPVQDLYFEQYYSGDQGEGSYKVPMAYDTATKTYYYDVNFNDHPWNSEYKFSIVTNGVFDNGDIRNNASTSVTAYKHSNNKIMFGDGGYVTISDATKNLQSVSRSEYNDVTLSFKDNSVSPKNYRVVYTPPTTGDFLNGQITITDKNTVDVIKPTVSIKGTTPAEIKVGAEVTITATVTPAKNNDQVVVKGEYTVTLYRGSVQVGDSQKVNFIDEATKNVVFNTTLESTNDSFHVVVTKDTYSATSNTVEYKQTAVKDKKIYFDPSGNDAWKGKIKADTIVNVTVKDGSDKELASFNMAIDTDDIHGLAKGVFRALVDEDTLTKLKDSSNKITFALSGDTVTVTADGNSSVTDGWIYTSTTEPEKTSMWAQYNTTYTKEYPHENITNYQQFEEYLKAQYELFKAGQSTDNIVYFDNSVSQWYNVYIYGWGETGLSDDTRPMKKLPYADIWYYDFGTTTPTSDLLFKDRSGATFGTDYQQTVDLKGTNDENDNKSYVLNGDNNKTLINFTNTINKANPIFITANFYKCTTTTAENISGNNVYNTLKFRAFNTEWKEFALEATSAVKTKAVDVYFDMHSSDALEIKLYHESTDDRYTMTTGFTRLTKLGTSNIYYGRIYLPYTTDINGNISTAFKFSKFGIIGTDGKETNTYPISDNVKPAADCITTGEVWYEYNVKTPEIGGILGYNHSTATFESTTGGSITDANVELKNGYYQDTAYRTGYATTTDGVTTVIYAIPTAKTGATTVYTTTTSGESGYNFNGWSKDGNVLSNKTTITDDVAKSTATVSYVANWSEVKEVTYTFVYNYDKFNTIAYGKYAPEYDPKRDLISDSYTVKVNVKENATPAEILALFKARAPRLSSDYFNYSFEGLSAVTTEGTTVSGKAEIIGGAKTYSVTLKDAGGASENKGSYFYQNIATLTQESAAGKTIVWKNADTKEILGYGNTYKFRITKNITISYEEIPLETSTDRTVVNAPTYEFYTSGSTQRVRFNFLVENFVDETAVEYGVLCFFTDSEGAPVDKTIALDKNISAETLKLAAKGGVDGIDKHIATSIVNNRNRYIFAPTLSYTSANTDRYLRVFSYFIKQDGTLVISDADSVVLGSIRYAIS